MISPSNSVSEKVLKVKHPVAVALSILSFLSSVGQAF
jgi:hypothetical protein